MLVMWGHVVAIHDSFYNWVTSFHVPVFLVITGFLFSAQNKQKSSFKKIFKKILRPYCVFSVVSVITDCGWSYYNGGGAAAAKSILIDCYKVISFYGIHALWYLSSYLIATGIYLYFVKNLNGLKLSLFIIISFGMGIAFSECSKYFEKMHSSILFPLVNFPVAALIRAIVCAAVIAIGNYVYFFLLKEKSRVVNGLCGVALLVFSFFMSLVSGDSNFSIVDYGRYPVVFIFVAISGAIGLLLTLQAFQCKSSALQYFGRNSLLFLVTHHSLKITCLATAITELLIPDSNKAFGIIVLCVLVSIDGLAVELIKHKLPWMIYSNHDIDTN